MCSLRNVVLFFARHLWLFFEVFSQTPFLTVMKNLIRVVFSTIASCEICHVSSEWQKYKERIRLCNVIAVFPLRELWHLDQENIVSSVRVAKT